MKDLRYPVQIHNSETQPVLWIRIRMDPELLPGFGSGIIVPDPDLLFRIRIPLNMKEQISKNVNSL